MREVLAALTRRWLVDSVLAAGAVIPPLIAILVAGPTTHDIATAVLVAVCGGVLFARHSWPVASSVALAVAYIVADQTRSFDPNLSTPLVNVVTIGTGVAAICCALAAGEVDRLPASVLGGAMLTVALEWRDLNPLPVVIVVGSWLVGRALLARGRLASALEARGAELESERDRYAAESVRYERARIARELHDIIAHNMSVVVIQAAAGQRLDRADRTRSDAMLDSIGELARQAEADIAALTHLLSDDADLARPLSRDVVDQLIAHATATGTAIDVSVVGDLDTIPSAASATLYRVLQEGLTNAFKHAPGAPISVSVNRGPVTTRLEIRNQPASTGTGLLRASSGGNGLRGLTERVAALAGSLRAEPTPPGGWRLTAVVPSNL